VVHHTRMTGSVRAAAAPRPEVVRLEITGLAPGGQAVGRQVGGSHDGRITFVSFAAPGELVRARIIREKRRLAWADLEAVERAAPGRATPRCPLFGRCGGCQWQHVTRDVQLDAKRRIVARALGRLDELRAVGPAYGYRDRARLRVGGGGSQAVGFRAWRSHEIVDVPHCPLFGPQLAAALPEVRARAAGSAPGTEIALGAGGEEVVARIGSRPAAFRVVSGIALEDGEGTTVDLAEPGSPPLRVPAGAFSQVGAAANAALVAAVLEAVGPGPGRTLELHAGSGNFTRHLVGRAAAVLASDADQAAVQRGRRNVPGADWRAAPPWPDPAGSFATVIVDPPRQGLDPVALSLACAAEHRLVYVSCDPQTLARDARRIAEAGLALERVIALDLMPQTYHVEVVASFRRR
jgi:23S rRNA (uracil1939-C5)-methyltransferase